ncbi:MAG TPA: BatA and WFA domain-containing protein [Phycisphaerales bacterium]|nr:BatA and WFA domain-containing protein [Phycisphaerales bacterium]
MTFLSLTLAGIAAAIAVPTLVILYFLKLRRRDMEVSTTLLWKKAIQDLQANAPFQRLRRNLLLFLQLLILGAVLFALAQPIIKAQTLTGSKLVILIDRSASMTATDVDTAEPTKTRLDQAKEQAIGLVDSMKEASTFFTTKNSGDQAMVIAFDNQAEPLQPFTNDKEALKAAIRAIQPTHKTTSVEQAVTVALANLPRRKLIENGIETSIEGITEGEPVTMHLYTDGKIPDAPKAKPGPENTMVFHQIGDEKAPNVAITALKAEREFERPEKLTIFVSLLNSQDIPRVVDVELVIDGSVVGIQSATIPAASTGESQLGAIETARAAAREAEAAATTGTEAPAATSQSIVRPGTSGAVFKLERTTGALAQVRLREPSTGAPPDGNVLSADDRAWLTIPPAKQLSIAVVGRGNLFIKSALEGMPLARLDEFTPTQFERAYADGKVGQYDVVVLDGVIPNLGQGAVAATPTTTPAPGTTPAATPAGIARPLPPGNYIVLNAIPAGSGIKEIETSKGASFIDWRRDHAVTRYLTLDPVQIANFRRVEVDPGSGVRTLASCETGPSILELSTNDTHAIIVPFDYMESNWPMHLSFVVFFAASSQYLGQEVSGGYDARALTPGTELRDRLPLGVTKASVVSPDLRGGTTTQEVRTAADGSIVFRTPPVSGVIEVTWEGPAAPGDVKDPNGTSVLRVYASNLLDPQESDAAAAKQVEVASAVVNAQSGQSTKSDRALWPYLLLGGLAIVLLEWFIYNRKVYV